MSAHRASFLLEIHHSIILNFVIVHYESKSTFKIIMASAESINFIPMGFGKVNDSIDAKINRNARIKTNGI